jgi:hypothetical protein
MAKAAIRGGDAHERWLKRSRGKVICKRDDLRRGMGVQAKEARQFLNAVQPDTDRRPIAARKSVKGAKL